MQTVLFCQMHPAAPGSHADALVKVTGGAALVMAAGVSVRGWSQCLPTKLEGSGGGVGTSLTRA